MPFYKVWYRNSSDPLEFYSASIVREEGIVARILAKENIKQEADAAPIKELIARHQLAPVRYTEDESEALTIA